MATFKLKLAKPLKKNGMYNEPYHTNLLLCEIFGTSNLEWDKELCTVTVRGATTKIINA